MKITIEIQDSLITEYAGNLVEDNSPLLIGVDAKDLKAAGAAVSNQILSAVQDHLRGKRNYFEAKRRNKVDTSDIDSGVLIPKEA